MPGAVVSIDRSVADAELRRSRKGMALHYCSMRTFVYIDRLESRLEALSARLEALENAPLAMAAAS